MSVTIIRSHYEKIAGHCRDSYPSEAGGFIGGRGDLILGIFPVPNFELWFHRDKRAFFWDEISKGQAEAVFKRYDMDIIGLYHSHPNGIALPSQSDFVAHKEYGLRIALIAGVADNKLIKLSAFSLPDPEHTSEDVPIDRFTQERLDIIEDIELENFINEAELKKEIQESTAKYLAQEEALKKRVAEILATSPDNGKTG